MIESGVCVYIQRLKRERLTRLFFVIVAFFDISYLLFVCVLFFFLSILLFVSFEWLFDSSWNIKQLDIGQNSCLGEIRVIIPLPIEIIMNRKKKKLWIRSYVLLWVQSLLSVWFRKKNTADCQLNDSSATMQTRE